MSELLVYIAGPYAHPDPIENTQAAVRAAERIYVPYRGLIPVVPHLTMLWHLISPHEVDFWYSYDLRVLDRCDVLWRLPGESTGADAEVSRARFRHIPVVYREEDLYRLTGVQSE